MGTAVFKDPDAVLKYEHDWAPFLADGDTVTTSDWTAADDAEDAVTIDDDTNTTTTATVTVAGGAPGPAGIRRYDVNNHIVTAGGEEDDWTLHVYVRNQ